MVFVIFHRSGDVDIRNSVVSDDGQSFRAEAMQQVNEHQFVVERYYIPFFEVIPSAPAYVLDSDVKYATCLSINFHCLSISFHRSRVLTGNTTVQVHARPVNTSIRSYRLVSEEHPPWVYHLISIVYYYRMTFC